MRAKIKSVNISLFVLGVANHSYITDMQYVYVCVAHERDIFNTATFSVKDLNMAKNRKAHTEARHTPTKNLVLEFFQFYSTHLFLFFQC